MTETSPNKQNTGMGNYQTDKANKARWAIFLSLSDGQWHRNMELREKTNLSSRTLAKHLTQMLKLRIIEKKKDTESGEYPFPVFYKTVPTLETYINACIERTILSKKLEPALLHAKDPLVVLDAIHISSQTYFTELISLMKENKKLSDEAIYFFGECFLWENYKRYTLELIKASQKIVDEINMHEAYVNQAKRFVRVYSKLIKAYEKMEQQNNNC